jgi:hypothetical protein
MIIASKRLSVEESGHGYRIKAQIGIPPGRVQERQFRKL